MSLLTILFRLKTIGIVLAKAGEILMRIGSAPSLTEIVREEEASNSDQEGMSQDSLNSNGVKDEEPAEDEVRVEAEQGDLFETSKPVGPPLHPQKYPA